MNEGNSAVVPDIYVDRMRLTVTLFGVNVSFGLSESHPDLDANSATVRTDEKVCLRMSLEHAKVVALLLAKQLKRFEREAGITIALPEETLQSLDIAEEPW